MPSLRVNMIASVAYRLGLGRDVDVVETTIDGESGLVVAARVLSEKRVYNQLEVVSGRMARINPGEVIVGALGCRRALQGFVGEVPASITAGDRLHVLNLGGVIGRATAVHRDLGDPTQLEVLGHVVRDGVPLNIADNVVSPVETLEGIDVPPLILVSGTCMNSGKTYAGSRIIQELSGRGLRVHAGKLTGVACRRDSIAMEDHGALRSISFLEAGVTSTAELSSDEIVRVARTVVGHLCEGSPDALVLELGDGVIGDYGVLPILEDREVLAALRAHVFCAGDMVGAWGGWRYLKDRGVPVHVISGPSTDTPVGVEFIQKDLGLPAFNARLEPRELAEAVAGCAGLELDRAATRSGQKRGAT